MLNYQNKNFNFKDVIYYDGPKLYIDDENFQILVWSQEFNDHDRCFLIKTSQAFFNDYISRKISLLEVIQKSNIDIVKRNYNNYQKLIFLDDKKNIHNYTLPLKNSFFCRIQRCN